MTSIFLVICAFALMFLSDELKLRKRTGTGKLAFLTGALVLVTAFFAAAFGGQRFSLPPMAKALFLLLAGAGAFGLYLSLFSALPAKATYLDKQEAQTLVDSGMYALCRHPGALWLPIFSGFLALGLANIELLAAAALSSLLNVLYVVYQDKRVFPKTIRGYDQYKKTVPFLFPTAQSFLRAVGRKSKNSVKQVEHEV